MPQTPLWMFPIWALWVLQVAWCCYNVRRFLRTTLRQKQFIDLAQHPQPRAVVIVPVKGAGADFDAHADALLKQDYPSYRVIFVVESESDPAYPPLQKLVHSQTHATPASLLVAGAAEACGQKVHNQLHALEHLLDDDDLIVFADADAVPGTDWLNAMAYGATRENRGAVTGYRWMVPADGGLFSRVGSVLNASVATLLGRPRWNQAWGGSMGLLRENMVKINLIEQMRGSLSDDFQFTRAVKKSGLKIYFVAAAMPISPVRFTAGELVSFTLRQYRITRVYAPAVWWMSMAALLLYAAGWATAVAALICCACPLAGGLIGGVLVLDAWRGLTRRRVFAACFGHEAADRWAPAALLDILATPVWMGLNLLLLAASVVGRQIKWAGITYRMRSPQDVQILKRDGA
jgi:ceramide glucosyltransferase